MSVFSQRLKQLRADSGKNQIDIANYLGVSVQSYSAYETGREPKYELLCKLADYFDCPIDYLLGRSDMQSPNISDMAINKRFGLSPTAIKHLEKGFDNVENYKNIVNTVIENKEFPYLVARFGKLIDTRRKYSREKYLDGTIDAIFAGVKTREFQEILNALPETFQKKLETELEKHYELIALPEEKINSCRRALDDSFGELVKDIMQQELNDDAETQNNS